MRGGQPLRASSTRTHPNTNATAPPIASKPHPASWEHLDWTLRVAAFGLLDPLPRRHVLRELGLACEEPRGEPACSSLSCCSAAPWRLGLLFLIAGAACHSCSTPQRLGRPLPSSERSSRLLLPLLFGMAVIVVPQAYFRGVDQGAATAARRRRLPGLLGAPTCRAASTAAARTAWTCRPGTTSGSCPISGFMRCCSGPLLARLHKRTRERLQLPAVGLAARCRHCRLIVFPPGVLMPFFPSSARPGRATSTTTRNTPICSHSAGSAACRLAEGFWAAALKRRGSAAAGDGACSLGAC